MKQFEITKIFISNNVNWEENSKKDYAYWINKFLSDVQEINGVEDSKYDIKLIESINSFIVSDVMNMYREKYALSTQNKIVATLTNFGKFLGNMPEVNNKNPFANLDWYNSSKVLRDQIRRRIENKKDILTVEEVKLILDNIPVIEKKSFKIARNQALISLYLTTGSRCRELLDMTMDMLDYKIDYYMVDFTEEQTKGDVAKRIPVANKTFEYFKNYLSERKKVISRADEQYKNLVFLSDGLKDIEPSVIRKMLQRYCDKLGIDKNVTTHGLRHTFRTELTRNGVNENLIRAIGGWSLIDANVDGRYFHDDERIDEDKVKACDII